MDELLVDLGGIDALVAHVRDLQTRLEEVPVLEQVQVRHQRLDRALGHFEVEEGQALRQAVLDVGELAARLEMAARCYRQMDEALALPAGTTAGRSR
ncbi:MAG TPA: hypothetical protein VGC67_18025 [Cellulomonas sp.]